MGVCLFSPCEQSRPSTLTLTTSALNRIQEYADKYGFISQSLGLKARDA